MTTRIESAGPTPVITSHPTAGRSTAQPTRPFEAIMHAGAGAVLGGAEAAVLRLPGGPVLAAAFRPTPHAFGSTTPSATSSATPEGYPLAGASGASGTGTSADGTLEGMLGQNSDRSLYYIALQERISAENRLYSAYSNVLRVRHETMKNAIGNFR